MHKKTPASRPPAFDSLHRPTRYAWPLVNRSGCANGIRPVTKCRFGAWYFLLDQGVSGFKV
jgi:hypothetical protein